MANLNAKYDGEPSKLELLYFQTNQNKEILWCIKSARSSVSKVMFLSMKESKNNQHWEAIQPRSSPSNMLSESLKNVARRGQTWKWNHCNVRIFQGHGINCRTELVSISKIEMKIMKVECKFWEFLPGPPENWGSHLSSRKRVTVCDRRYRKRACFSFWKRISSSSKLVWCVTRYRMIWTWMVPMIHCCVAKSTCRIFPHWSNPHGEQFPALLVTGAKKSLATVKIPHLFPSIS